VIEKSTTTSVEVGVISATLLHCVGGYDIRALSEAALSFMRGGAGGK